MQCPTCGTAYLNMNAHFAQSPRCNPQQRELAPPPPTAASTAGNEAGGHFTRKFARRINLDYGKMRYKHFIDTSHCSIFHASAIGWFDLMMETAFDAAATATNVKDTLRLMRSVFTEGREVMNKYTTQAQRDAYLKNSLKAPYISPMPFNKSAPEELRKNAAKLSISQLIARIMQNDIKARQLIIAKSNEWMEGNLHNKRAEVLTDITDGWVCRSHEHLMRKATTDEISRKIVRIGIGVHNDGATFVNGLGTKKGEHKDEVTDGNIINLPLSMRHSFEYFLLLHVPKAAIRYQ